MESLIIENFKFGNHVEIIFKGCPIPLEAKFLKCGDGAILVKSASGKKIIIPLNEIMMIRQGVIPTASAVSISSNNFAPERNVLKGKTFTPLVSIPKGNDKSDSTIPESTTTQSESDAEMLVEVQTIGEALRDREGDGTGKTVISDDLFKLPSEQTDKPQLKILGSIELNEEDLNRRRFRKETPDTVKDPEVGDDFRDTKIPAMGVLKSIGPVYGYIKMPDGPDIYCNRGEFLLRNGEDIQPYQGMPVVFTPGSNWKGTMAKCIHEPMTVGEQLELIEELLDTDLRNAKLLGRQLAEAFPDSQEVADALEIFPHF